MSIQEKAERGIATVQVAVRRFVAESETLHARIAELESTLKLIEDAGKMFSTEIDPARLRTAHERIHKLARARLNPEQWRERHD
jgi:hypothetical protein